MPVCQGPSCALPVDRPYEHAAKEAAKLRAEADEHLAEAHQHADELRARADEVERVAELERSLDDLPLCPNHQRTLRVETAGDLLSTRDAPKVVRARVLERAKADLVRGVVYG